MKKIRIRLKEFDSDGNLNTVQKVIGYTNDEREREQLIAAFSKTNLLTPSLQSIYNVYMKKVNLSKLNKKNYDYAFRKLNAYHQKEFIKLRSNILSNFLRKQTYSTAKKIKTLLYALDSFALEIGLKNIDNLFDFTAKVEKVKQSYNGISEADILKIKNENNEIVNLVVDISLETGLKVAEILNLKIENIDFENSKVVFSKHMIKESYPISSCILNKLEEIQISDFIIQNTRGKKLEPYDFRRYYWNPLMEKLGFDYSAYDLHFTYLKIKGEKH